MSYTRYISSYLYSSKSRINGGVEHPDKPLADLKTCLELQVGKWGDVRTEYGGFEIEVVEPAYFPWYDVFATLLKFGYEVWVSLKKDKLVIIASVQRD